MRFLLFLITILIVLAGAFLYLTRDRGFSYGTDSEYCHNVERIRHESEYQFSYGERVAHVVRGCW